MSTPTPGDHNPEHMPAVIAAPGITPLPIMGDGQAMDPQQDLLDVRNIRAQISNLLLADRDIVKDPKQLRNLLTVLKDMDSASLGAIRIKLEEEGADREAQARELAAAIMQQVSDQMHAKRTIPGVGLVREVPREIPVLPDDVETRPFVPGEATQGTVHQTFDQFQQRTGEIKLNGDDSID